MDKKDLYKEINQHLASIDDSLKTLAWVQSATLSMNRENMKKLNDTTNKMMSSFSSLSQSDDNSDDDKNNVPSDKLWLPKSAKWYRSNRTFIFRYHVTNRDYENQQSVNNKGGE